MAEIKLYDYTELIDDGWGWTYEQDFYIGQGLLSASVIVPQIDAVPDGEAITVKINSCGGLVFDGWAIYNALIAAKMRGCNIIVRIEGLAASIASIIAMAGDNIIICQAAMLMIHKPTVDPFWYGTMDAEDLKREALALDQIQAVLNSIYQSKTNLDTAVIDSMINAETYITPNEAVTLGFADSIENTIIQNTMAQNAFNHIFKNADVKIMAYANSTIKINKAMSEKIDVKETLRKNTENLEKSNSLLAFFKNLIPKAKNAEGEETVIEAVNASSELDAGGSIYYDGTLAVGTEVFSDAEMTTHPAAGDIKLKSGSTITVDSDGLVTVVTEADTTTNSAEIEALKAENAKLAEQLNKATESILNMNTTLEKLKNIKSTFTPEAREQEIIDKNKQVEKSEGITMDAIKARREERKNLNKAK